MIYLTIAEYVWLRKGNEQTLRLPAGQRRPKVGRAYRARTREEVPRQLTVTVTGVLVDDATGDLVVSVSPGNTREQPRLLRARMGAGGDYTSEPSLAAVGEPEAVPEGVQERFSRQASDRDHEARLLRVRLAREHLERGAQILEGGALRDRRAAKEIRREIDRLA